MCSVFDCMYRDQKERVEESVRPPSDGSQQQGVPGHQTAATIRR